MNVAICLVTPEVELRRSFEALKTGPLERDLARGYFRATGLRIAPVAWRPRQEEISAEGFERFFLKVLSRTDGVLLLVDPLWRHLVQRVDNAVFLQPVEAERARLNPKNAWQQVLSAALRRFGRLLALFEKGSHAWLTALPLRNFHAPQLVEMARLMREESADPELPDRLEALLSELRECVRPRRATSRQQKYAVDNRGRFFTYGLEQHSQYATGGRHLLACDVNGRFRFGRRLDKGRHFNVSEGEGDTTTVGGDFKDCHHRDHPVSGRTHLNMFANDYFGYDEGEA